MQGKIAVEILGHRIRDLLSLEQPGERKRLRLTTSDDLQKAGKVRIYLIREGEQELLKEIVVERIPPARAGEPNIDLVGEYTSRRTLILRLYINGKPHMRGEIDLKPYLKGRKRALLFVIPAALILLALFLLFLGPFKGFLDGIAGRARPLAAARSEERRRVEEPAPVPEPRVSEEERPAERPERAETPVTEEPVSAEEVGEEEQEAPPPGITEGKILPEPERVEPEKPPALLGEEVKVYFAPDIAVLTRATEERLRELLPVLRQNPSLRVTIIGHCALYGSEAGRQKLSLQRAGNVARFLYQNGWEPETEPLIEGLGGSKPVTLKREDQYLNRRVELSY